MVERILDFSVKRRLLVVVATLVLVVFGVLAAMRIPIDAFPDVTNVQVQVIATAPALAAASVGIAMGVAGADAALETADVALMADALGKLPEAITLGRRTERII